MTNHLSSQKVNSPNVARHHASGMEIIVIDVDEVSELIYYAARASLAKVTLEDLKGLDLGDFIPFAQDVILSEIQYREEL